jgi:hypothetical protein
MARLSKKRKQAIYDAVHDRLMDLRVEISRDPTPHTLDDKLSRAMDQAGHAAIEAAETGRHTRSWRGGT